MGSGEGGAPGKKEAKEKVDVGRGGAESGTRLQGGGGTQGLAECQAQAQGAGDGTTSPCPVFFSPARLEGFPLFLQYSDGVFYDLDSSKHPSYMDPEGMVDSLWGWTEPPPSLAASYEPFDPSAASLGHFQGLQLSYLPVSYGPSGQLEAASGPGPSTYPEEDFGVQPLPPICPVPQVLAHLKTRSSRWMAQPWRCPTVSPRRPWQPEGKGEEHLTQV
ncbi:transcription factor Spi-B [Dromiciops gliroides]|uniref:transcription factor Spi-B n=1 Tax=Dromiciops gliroides TaxID=33562 RepID=UPI001CC3D17F|nr:transcription factor Spi-B [Dromiciops gliroides]